MVFVPQPFKFIILVLLSSTRTLEPEIFILLYPSPPNTSKKKWIPTFFSFIPLFFRSCSLGNMLVRFSV